MRYFVTSFLHTSRKSSKNGWLHTMNGTHAHMPWLCNPRLIQSFTYKRNKQKSWNFWTWTQISINIKIYKEGFKVLFLCITMHNLKTFWFKVFLWRMQTSYISLTLSQTSSTTKDFSKAIFVFISPTLH
jgi:hypothetical protein